MPLQPLTHHEILELVEPFSRRGRHVDLAATNRLERKIAFKPVEHPATAAHPKVVETLTLWQQPGNKFLLTRTLGHEHGLQATLEIDGPSPKDLMERLDAVPIARAFSSNAGLVAAQSHAMTVSGSVFMDVERMTLTGATAKTADLDIALRMSRVAGYPAELEIDTPTGAIKDLPDDLVAVLGREFGFLNNPGKTWKTNIKMPGREPQRSRRAEQKIADLTTHLAETLSAPPETFHQKYAGARWKAAFRRSLPLVICFALIALAAGISKLGIDPNSSMQLLLFNLPGLMLIAIFSMRELPRLQLPRFPKPLATQSWRATTAAAEPTVPHTFQVAETKALG